jgi:hypothetical protein
MKNLKALSLVLILTALSSTVFAAPYAFPVPFVANQNSGITFTGLSGAGSIKIYTISGQKVADLPVAQGQGLVTWNVENNSGEDVASGVYIYLVDTDGMQTKNKLVVIR